MNFISKALGVSWILLSFVFALTPAISLAQKHAEWTPSDSAEATQFIHTFTQHPESIDTLIKRTLKRDHTLGFGYMLREAWINPAGKLGFALKIIYQKKQAVSFEIKPIYNYQELESHYSKILVPTFKMQTLKKSGISFAPYYWNLEKVSQPLERVQLKMAAKINEEDSITTRETTTALAFYSSPFSGTIYGMRGGDNHQLLENRANFLALEPNLKGQLSADLEKNRRLIRSLLRSINPATRLTAVEFILHHSEEFSDFSLLQKKVFPLIFMNPSKVTTLRGNREVMEDARKLCLGFSKLTLASDPALDTLGVLRMY